MSAPQELVERLRRDPDDEETAAVLGDWCEERGFTSVAARLRAPLLRREYLHAVWTLSSLFGLEGTVINRYTFVHGLPNVAIGPADTDELELSCDVPFRLRRLVFPSRCRESLQLRRMMVGPNLLLRGGLDPVPVEVFGAEVGFDTFDVYVMAGMSVRLELENFSDQAVMVMGCLLGDEPEVRSSTPSTEVTGLPPEWWR